MYSFLFCLCVSSFLDRFNTQASARNGHCLNCWKRSRLCASVTTAATLVILNALELGGQDKIIPILEYFSLSGRVLFFSCCYSFTCDRTATIGSLSLAVSSSTSRRTRNISDDFPIGK